MIVDAHHHFWRIDRDVYDWIDDDLWELRRDYLPAHLQPYLKHLGIDKTILVQAAETLTDNPFLVDQAQAAGFVGGIVAWVDLTAPDAQKQISDLAQHDIIKGIRPVLQDITDDAWVLQPKVLSALRHVAAQGLRFDALIQPRHLNVIQALSDKVPDLPIVIDHAAKPVIAKGGAASQGWKLGMAALAQNPAVHCKLSGLATEYGHGWHAHALRPICDHLLSHFGPKRLMWGSDWPVLERHGSYSQWFTAAHALVEDADAPLVFGQTAASFYGL